MFAKRKRTYEWAIAQVLRYIRKGLSLSLREVEAATGISEQTLGRLERGEHFPRNGMDMLKALSRFYGISMATIMSEADRVYEGLLPSIELDIALENRLKGSKGDDLTQT